MRTPLPIEEFFEIASGLEKQYSLFRTLWDIGKPSLVDDTVIPTACIVFNRDSGIPLEFLWNQTFYESCTPYLRSFVAAHEMVHILLNHGERMVSMDHTNVDNINIAMDIVVNTILVKHFGFDREKIESDISGNQNIKLEKLAWIDTVFGEVDGLDWRAIPEDKAFEYYYNLMNVHSPDAKISGLDVHGITEGTESDGGVFDTESMLDELSEYLQSEEALEKLEPILKAYGDSDDGSGNGIGKWFDISKLKNRRVYKKWESVISSWKRKTLKYDFHEFESWIRANRRMTDMIDGVPTIPTESEFEDYYVEVRRVKIWFFLDTSGSCFSYKDRFFKAAKTLDNAHFSVELFSFDTNVNPIKSDKIYGGGGTSFSAIEKFIIASDQEYPDVVFVITDGIGDIVNPKFPNRWFWFLIATDEKPVKRYIPKNSKCYNLSDYE